MANEMSGVEAVSKILKEEGVQQIYGVHGAHIWGMLEKVCGDGINMMHFRHEQSGVYAADGWARVMRKPAVCFGTASPGMYSMVGALAHAYLCRSPIVAIVGQHPTDQDGWGSWQEAYGEDVCRTFTKWSKRVLDTETISFWMQKAFRDAVAYPPGPVLLEIPGNVLGRMGNAVSAPQIGYVPKGENEVPRPSQGDPVEVEKAVSMLLKSEKPIVMAGNGVYWSEASDELREFVELTQIPVHTRRIGRGAVPEDHPLTFTGGYRRPLFKECDVMLVVGHQLNSLENFGRPPTYSDNTEYIQVGESESEFSPLIRSKISIWGNPKLVLRQMIDCAKSLLKETPDRAEWHDTIAEARDAHRKKQREEAEEVRGASPMHPRFAAQEIVDFLDDSATIIYDSFTFVSFLTDRIEAKFAGQVLDGSTYGGVGHSIGMGMGAQLARPGKQVIGFIGDGGLGYAGFDLETAARYKIPAVYFLWNNSGWMSTTFQKAMFPSMDSWGMQNDIRYDKIFAEMGCHTELITESDQVRPALERAFNSGQTSVINAVGDKTVLAGMQEARMKNIKKKK